MNKSYEILLNGNKVGATQFENADAPMGVVFGKIHFFEVNSPYDLFRNYCLENQIELSDYPDEKLLSTRNIPDLKVINESGIEIVGNSTSVSGMDSDGFEIEITGIPYPFYEIEFAEHVDSYKNMLKD